MGYAVTIPNVIVECASEAQATNFTITNFATNFSLNQITIPTDLQGAIYHAYVDIHFPIVKEIGGADNQLNGDQYIKVYKTWPAPLYNAIKFVDNSLMVPANYEGSYGRIYGNIDIAPYISAGDTIYAYWENSLADAIGIRIYGNQTILRLMLGA